MDMDKETQKRVEEVVPDRKLLVKQIIDTFSEQFEREKTTKEDEQEEDEQEEKCDKVVNTFCEKVEREKTTRDYKEEEEDEEEEEEQAKKNVADDNEMRTKKRKTDMESIVGGGGEDEETKDILICKLSKMRMVTVRKYNGVRYVCIRNYILRDEKMLPTEKGVNMKVEQWEALCNASPEIEKALKKLEDNTDDIS